MVLVDTSVWVFHLRNREPNLETLLNEGKVVCHPFIIGELACGNLKNREEILSLMRSLPMAVQASHDEVLEFIESNRLMGKGVGYADVHLLASAVLTGVRFWTFDKRLRHVSSRVGVAFAL
jgi:predicted nucleic acid-binding protein